MATLDQELVSYLRGSSRIRHRNAPLTDLEIPPMLLANTIESRLDAEGNVPAFSNVARWEDNFVEELMFGTNDLRSLTTFTRRCLIEMDVIMFANDHGHHSHGESCDDFVFFLRNNEEVFHETGRTTNRISFHGLGSGEFALKKPTADEIALIKEMAINANALEEL